MEKIRGRSLQERKEYCSSENVPVKTMKYIICLEERIAAISVTRCCETFYCWDEQALGKYRRCQEECDTCASVRKEK
jgi:hypothetical protein